MDALQIAAVNDCIRDLLELLDVNNLFYEFMKVTVNNKPFLLASFEDEFTKCVDTTKQRQLLLNYAKARDQGWQNLVESLRKCHQSFLADKLTERLNRYTKAGINVNSYEKIDTVLLKALIGRVGHCQAIRKVWHIALPKSDIQNNFYALELQITYDDSETSTPKNIFEDGITFTYLFDANFEISSKHVDNRTNERQLCFRPQTFVLTGRPGSGKTTYLNRLAASWRYSEVIRRHYHYVMVIDAEQFLQLHGIPKSVYELVRHIIGPVIENESTIDVTLLMSPRTLILIDNFDKLDSDGRSFFTEMLKDWEIKYQAQIIISTRLHSLKYFQCLENKVIIKVLGFQSDTVKHFLADQLSSQGAKTRSDKILNQHCELLEVLKTPLYAATFVVILVHDFLGQHSNQWLDFEIYQLFCYYNKQRQHIELDDLQFYQAHITTGLHAIIDTQTQTFFTSDKQVALDVSNVADWLVITGLCSNKNAAQQSEKAQTLSKQIGFFDELQQFSPATLNFDTPIRVYASENFKLFFASHGHMLLLAEHYQVLLPLETRADLLKFKPVEHNFNGKFTDFVELTGSSAVDREQWGTLFQEFHENELFPLCIPCLLYQSLKLDKAGKTSRATFYFFN